MFAINSISSSVSSMSSQDQISFSSDQNRKDSNESSKGDNSDRTFIVALISFFFPLGYTGQKWQ
jgi:hypothetical protein